MKKSIYIISVIVLLESWVLGFMRFEFHVLSYVYSLLNFPFGYFYLKIEDSLIQNEILQMLVWFLSVGLQAFLYYWLFNKLWNSKYYTKT